MVTWPFLIRRPRFFFLLPLLALFGLGAWILVSMVLSMHAGGIVMIHLLWLIALGVALVAETIISAVSGAGKANEDEPPAGA